MKRALASRPRRHVGGTVMLLGALTICASAASSRSGPIEFNRDIRPILSDKCFHCHGPDQSKRKAGLRLDTETGATADLGGHAAIVPGHPEKSEAHRRITTNDPDDVMPPLNSGRSLSPREIELLTRWIGQGAKWEPHWAFVPPQRPGLPPVKNKRWPKNPIDHFILARLEGERLKPSAPAAKETLLRRVTLDLTGLPPAIEEVEAFLRDKSPDAYEKVVDRLLASPRYGERMALEWLDAARYADSNGYQGDAVRTMWPWRDWLINALNRDLPFDRFTIEMLAGDLLPDATTEQRVASGFNRNHPLNGEGGRIAEESRVDYVVDRVDTTATVWLGLTMACARCHDHKYDPFSQKEYFQLYDYFNHVPETGAVDARGMANPVLSLPTPQQTERMASLKQKIISLEMESEAAAEDSTEREELKKKIDETRKSLDGVEKSVLRTMVMAEREEPRDTFVLIRGAWDQPGEKVTRGVPAILPPLPDNAPGNRLGLAQWLVDPGHPLTARVIVNRYWEQFFGAGLVKTSEDFGLQGEWPVHKELLDWLATEFAGTGASAADVDSLHRGAVQRPWSPKHIHRLIVTSAAYRQSSKVTPQRLERDPDNRLLARGPRFRLSSLALRDQALAVSGLLVEKIGGPPVRPYQPPGIWEEMSFGKISYQQDKGEALYRRSLYIFWRRTVGPTMFFDTSARQVCTVRLPRTNTPLQSLVTLNEPAYVEAARVLGERMMTAANKPEERIRLAFRLATARHPKSGELKILKQSLERLLTHYRADAEAAEQLVSVGEKPRNTALDTVELAAYTGVANVILNLDEVLNKE